MSYIEHLAETCSGEFCDFAVKHTENLSRLICSELHKQNRILMLKNPRLNPDDLETCIVFLFDRDFRRRHAEQRESYGEPKNRRKLGAHIKKQLVGSQVSAQFVVEYHQLLVHCLNYYNK